MKSRFTLVALLALGLGFTACEDAFNEKDAIEAQKELLTLKYQNEMELEKLRQSATTALKQLEYTNLIAQIKFEDSLRKANNKEEASKRSYTITVNDVSSGIPVAGATVSVISEGTARTAETNELGIAIFDNLLIYYGAHFQVTKEGYAATLVSNTFNSSYNVRLWNVADAKNEVKGKVYIETDLTNAIAETAPANALVTATVEVPATGNVPSYKVQFPTTTDASGNYSITLPDAPSNVPYTFTFGQVAADQKLYINYTQDDANKEFPNALPRVATLKTYFGLYSSSANYPWGAGLRSSLYVKFQADTLGNVAYARLPIYETYDNGSGSYIFKNNWVTSSGTSGEFALEGIYLVESEVAEPEGVSRLAFNPNDTITVTLVDYSGNYFTTAATAPKLVAYTNGSGEIKNSPNTQGIIDFVRKANGELVDGAKGKFKKDPEFAILNRPDFSINTGSATLFDVKGGTTIIRNFSYGTGSFREKAAF
jgi:hypothetical protein